MARFVHRYHCAFLPHYFPTKSAPDVVWMSSQADLILLRLLQVPLAVVEASRLMQLSREGVTQALLIVSLGRAPARPE